MKNKSIKSRDYSFVAFNHKNKKCVKATNTSTKELLYFNSMYFVQQHLQINAGIVKIVCDGINNCKSGVSKRDGQSYEFEYVKKEDIPDNYLKSANKRQRMPKKERNKKRLEYTKKWQNKTFECISCGKTYKNQPKYKHEISCGVKPDNPNR